VLMADADLTGDALTGAVLPIITSTGRLEQMSHNAAAHGVRDAAARLADMVFAAAAKGHT
jgi:UDP-N-acetylglucosamine--N-acetylmuramyl-(pentapeptide) pyrophosphoryl-undecaprenol N-acetylglucosamine transferase